MPAEPTHSFRPRPAQQKVLAYAGHGGRMGVSAVPGSGKTFTLSCLAARLIERGLDEEQEVLIVTFANSAVDNFRARIQSLLQRDAGLLPLDYRVRTLHGLAHDIIRERPPLGLADDFDILDERVTLQIIEEVTHAWVQAHPEFLDTYLAGAVEESKRTWVQRSLWPKQAIALAGSFIRRAKDLRQTPADLRERYAASAQPLPLMEMGLDVYEDYQRALSARGGLDFDDLVRMALLTLEMNPDLLARLRLRWPYVLEDEAQDSSELQEEILRLLTDGGNWVRVGDPNQAINTTFTTSNVRFLNYFLDEAGVLSHELPNSGRSTRRIIDLANHLVDWTVGEHPCPELQGGFAFRLQHIEPAPPGDPQPNPVDGPEQVVHLYNRRLAPDDELDLIVRSLAEWMPAHRDKTAAVLVPNNERGFKLIELLRARRLPCDELLRSTATTRQTANRLRAVVDWLVDPLNSSRLAHTYQAWALQFAPALALEARKEVAAALRRCSRVESFVAPGGGDDWLEEMEMTAGLREPIEHMEQFRDCLRGWLDAASLPVDQLLLTIAQDMFTSAPPGQTLSEAGPPAEGPVAPARPSAPELALSYKLALVLRRLADLNPDWRLGELSQELGRIGQNQRRFLGFSEDDLGYAPVEGRVTVSTMHKAKGLEWDRVYLLGVNNYDFPSALPQDYYMGEQWYVRDRLNLEAEALAQLEALVHDDYYDEGAPTHEARLDYSAERLRLLYVGITRAKEELVITWNGGRRGDCAPAEPFLALLSYWEEHLRSVEE